MRPYRAIRTDKRPAATGGRADSRGLTLVETLVATTLLAMVIGSVVASLAGGLSVWQRLNGRSVQDQWFVLAASQVRQDLRNARRFGPIGFEGEYDEFAFPGLVWWQPREQPGREELGRRGYYFDSARRILCRSEVPYRQVRAKRLRDMCRPVLTGLSRVRFSYYVWDEDAGSYDWTSSCSSEEPPLAVKMELGYDDPASARPRTQTLLVRIPSATVR